MTEESCRNGWCTHQDFKYKFILGTWRSLYKTRRLL